MARKKTVIKQDIKYRDGDIKVQYVARLNAELPAEHSRIIQAIRTAIRYLKTLSRSQHTAIRSALFQLNNCIEELPPDTKPEVYAKSIAYMSYSMDEVLKKILAKMSNCKVDSLTLARFQLEYGQTPKKRDRDDLMCAKRSTKRKYNDDDEERRDDD